MPKAGTKIGRTARVTVARSRLELRSTDRAATQREAESPDLGVRDVGPRGEPVEQILGVLHLLWAVETELAAGSAGAAGVAGKRGEAELRQH